MTRENEEPTSIPEQAAHWWVVFRHGEPTPIEKREFVEWVTHVPEHVEASLRVARMQSAVSRPDIRWPATPAEELIRDAKAVPDDTLLRILPRAAASRAAPRRRHASAVRFGLAASLLIAVCAGWFAFTRPEQFQTKLGEQRSVMLADGSRVTLNTASKIEVSLHADRRVIELVKGEALFEVAHDANRPFDVHVGNVVVRAVGTEFDIDRRATRTTVTVSEGRVRVFAPESKELPILGAGDRVVVDGAGAGSLQHGVDLAETNAWTQRQLVFRHRALGEIAEEFNRYSAGRIEIRSPALQAQEVTGTFRVDDSASFIALLAGIPGVHVVSDGAGGSVVTFAEAETPGK